MSVPLVHTNLSLTIAHPRSSLLRDVSYKCNLRALKSNAKSVLQTTPVLDEDVPESASQSAGDSMYRAVLPFHHLMRSDWSSEQIAHLPFQLSSTHIAPRTRPVQWSADLVMISDAPSEAFAAERDSWLPHARLSWSSVDHETTLW